MKEKKKKKAGEKATSLCTQGYPTESTSVIAHNLHPNVSHFSSISEPTLQYIYIHSIYHPLYVPINININIHRLIHQFIYFFFR